MTSALHYRFAEILDEALPDLPETVLADLVDECVENLAAALSKGR